MMQLKNSVQLIGRLGKDPELQQLKNGGCLTKFSLATNDSYKNARGERVMETQWHNLIAWGRVAELMEKLLQKGNEVMVRGKLTHQSYEDKSGITRYSSQVVVSEFMLLNKPKGTTA